METATLARTNGPGYADRLTTFGGEPYIGPDGLDLRDPQARCAWTSVLCNDIREHEGGYRPCDRPGKMGWFQLRLTDEEVMSVFRAAENEGLIETSASFGDDDDGRWTLDSRRMSIVWRLSESGHKVARLRGTGIRDTFHRLPKTFKQAYALSVVLLGSTVAAACAAIGLKIASQSAVAYAFAIGAVWAFITAVVVLGYVDSHNLRLSAEAWPRMRHDAYRPARYRYETDVLRSPFGAGLVAVGTVVAGVTIAWTLNHGWKPHHGLPHVVWLSASILAPLIALIVAVAMGRAHLLCSEFRNEAKHRKKEFLTSSEPQSRYERRGFRVCQLLLR